MPLFGKKPQKPAQPAGPAKPKRTEAELKAEAAKLAARMGQQAKRPMTKEEKLREMMQNDPEKAAALIRELLLKGK